MTRRRLPIGLGALIAAVPLLSAQAQTMDYGRLEQLFGGPVTTSATGSPQRVSDVPANMEIITADDIRRSGATDLPGVLSHVPSLDVLQWGTAASDIGVRGYDQPFSPRLLVLVNGRQVYLDHYGFTQWSAIPVQLSEIRQIEIVKGPNAALFGFNAVGGVVNVVTYDPLVDKVRSAEITTGTQNEMQGSGVATARIGDRFGLKLSGGGNVGSDFSGLHAMAAREGLPQRNQRWSLGADAHFKLSDSATFEFEATHATANQLDVAPGYQLDYSKYDVSSVMGRLAAETGLGLMQATAYTNFAEHQVTVPALVTPADFRNQITVVQLQDLFQAGAEHTFRISGEYRHNSVNTSPIAGGTVFYDVGSVSAMWDWRVLPSVTLTQALRFDHLQLGRSGAIPPGYPFNNSLWNRAIDEASFNVGAVYHASPDDVLRLTAARGLQLPSLLEFGAFQQGATIGVGINGNPNIAPSTVMNYELGWEHDLRNYGIHTKAALFYQTTDDIENQFSSTVILPPAAPAPLILADNIGDSREVGLELSVKGSYANGWRWGLGYSPRFVTDRFDPTQPSSFTAVDFAHSTPRHVVNASLGWSGGPWEIDGFARFQSNSVGYTIAGNALALTPVRVGSYLALDARIAYRINETVTLAVAAQNLTADAQAQTAVGTVDRRVMVSLASHF